jgi:hypothetical protein
MTNLNYFNSNMKAEIFLRESEISITDGEIPPHYLLLCYKKEV